jgi:hypothetical protein
MSIPAKQQKVLKDLVRTTTNKMSSLAPIRTGNLRRKIKSANTFSQVTGRISSKEKIPGLQSTLTYFYAPQGAEYGQWFNDPPSVRSKRRQSLKNTAERKGNWQYKDNTFNDPTVQKLTQEYVSMAVSNFVKENIFQKFKSIK